MINRTPVRDRLGALGWRRGPQYRRSRVMPVEGRGLSSRQTQQAVRDREIGQPNNSETCSEAADGVARESEGRSRLSLLRPVRQSMDASRRKMIPMVSTAWMHESIQPVDGAVRAPGLDGVRCFWPHKIIGRVGLVVHQAWKLRPLSASHQYSPRILSGPLGAEQKRAAPKGAAYCCLRLSKTQAIRAVLLARATIVRLKPRRATSAFSQVDCRSSCLADRLTMARAPWISWRLR